MANFFCKDPDKIFRPSLINCVYFFTVIGSKIVDMTVLFIFKGKVERGFGGWLPCLGKIGDVQYNVSVLVSLLGEERIFLLRSLLGIDI